jgi:putative hemolysin
VRQEINRYPHSRYPVVDGSYDAVVGFVHVRDLYQEAGVAQTVRDLARPVKLLPATKSVLPSMSEMRHEGHHLAIVVDEYGGTAGIVSLEDLVEEVIGEIRDEYDSQELSTTRRLAGGSIEVDGLLNLADFTEETGVDLPEGPYETVAGFVVSELGHLPELGEQVEVGAGYRLAVAALDGRRVDRVRVTRAVAAAAAPAPQADSAAQAPQAGGAPPADGAPPAVETADPGSAAPPGADAGPGAGATRRPAGG